MKTQIQRPAHSRTEYTAEYRQQALELWRKSGRSAAKGDLRLSAASSLEVLGLCLMRSTRGADWKASADEINRYLHQYYPKALEGSDDA